MKVCNVSTARVETVWCSTATVVMLFEVFQSMLTTMVCFIALSFSLGSYLGLGAIHILQVVGGS